MKILIILLLLCSNCYGAELLVKAEDAWGKDEARSRKGDIIVVRPDGWEWGREECLPRFIVVKLPNVKEEDVKYLEQSLMDNTDKEKPVMLKRRKYSIGSTYTDSINTLGGKASVSKTLFDANVVEKVK
jgi:hypothetical protein